MFRTTSTDTQLDMFSSTVNIICERDRDYYNDENGWHNQFYKLVTSQIDERAFEVLFKKGNMGAPNASIRVLVAMNIIKEGLGCNDVELMEKCRYDLLFRKALGLEDINDAVPSINTYYLLRRRCVEYDRKEGVDLIKKAFQNVTSQQVKLFNISGKTVRMDSKLIGSNIASYSRYEIVHDTLRLYVKQYGLNGLNPSLRVKVNEVLNEDPEKAVYRLTSSEIQERMKNIGIIIYRILVRVKAQDDLLLKRVFNEQFIVEKGKVTPRDKKLISAKSVQNPHDPDAEYRNKAGKSCKGYSTNITETCDEEGKPSLITGVEVKGATAADKDYVESGIEDSEYITGNKVTRAICDGGYNSQSNREYAAEKGIEILATGLSGKESRYQVNENNGEFSIIDKKTEKIYHPAKTKGGRYRIETGGETKYRYFTQQQIDSLRRRQEFSEVPQSEKNKRNNVEAAMFQYSFHTRNGKTRYRGMRKHRMQAYYRCMWMNFRRLMLFQMSGNDGLISCFITHFSAKKAYFFLKSLIKFGEQKKYQYFCIEKIWSQSSCFRIIMAGMTPKI